jgi:hypothetical protein
MQIDLHEFLSRLARTVAMALVPVLLTAFLTMPATLHHHVGQPAIDPNAPPAHMT